MKKNRFSLGLSSAGFIKVHLQVRQFFCFWKHFVGLNHCAIFFALRQTFTVLLDSKLSI